MVNTNDMLCTTIDEHTCMMQLTDADDIEAYLTTFETMMGAYKMEKTKWSFRLAPPVDRKNPASLCGDGLGRRW